MGNFNFLGSAKLWLFCLVITTGCLFFGFKLSHLDNGSSLTPVSHYYRDKVITENVSIYYRNNAEYLEYLGQEYLIPTDKVIFLGETSKDYKGLFNEKVIKTIFFDDDTNDFVYREESLEKSYQIEKARKALANLAVWARVGSLVFWFIGLIFGLIFMFLFALWVEDLMKSRKTY